MKISQEVLWTSVLACALGHVTSAGATDQAHQMIVTTSPMQSPLVVTSDPKRPRQPLPAHDGADYLRTIPGFAVIRKGGTDGDPLFRGMAASRVNILLDGEQVLGGCGNRMDPPTAYVFPESFDRIVVTKGPQSVLHGPGASAATVSFERAPARFPAGGWSADASAVTASSDRHDLFGDVRFGRGEWFGRFSASRADAGDYDDGDGRTVHSAYERWSVNGAMGWAPDAQTVVELTGTKSDGEAAYADRGMDGVRFDRENLGLRLERRTPAPGIGRLEARAYFHYVDHVMDNFSLRDFTPTSMMPGRAVSNPDRRTRGGRLLLELEPLGELSLSVGADLQENEHSLRMSMDEAAMPYEAMPRVDDAWFRSLGFFAQASQPIGRRSRLIGGLRADAWDARDERDTLRIGMGTQPNPTAGQHREDTLLGGFARIEHGLRRLPGATTYLGVGYTERFPDYWELVSAGKESVQSLSAFGTRPEQTAQLDAGIVWQSEQLALSLSAFASEVDDYILIETGVTKGMRTATITRNVDAHTLGAEADLAWEWPGGWRLGGTLAWTRGENDSDGRPLAQMPPLELRTTLDYRRERWSAGLLWRLVDDQDRYATRQGNVVGQDLGPSAGFGVISMHGSWSPRPSVTIAAGVDNLLDKRYAEHLSRAGAMVIGFEQTTRVNEPGATAWLRAAVRLH
jgi:iron complex outermembrane receptor protein